MENGKSSEFELEETASPVAVAEKPTTKLFENTPLLSSEDIPESNPVEESVENTITLTRNEELDNNPLIQEIDSTILPNENHMTENSVLQEGVISSNTIVKDKKEDSHVKLITVESEEGIKTYKVEIDPVFVQQCLVYDKDWDEDFKKIAQDYPYTMSPKTTELIAQISVEMKREMLERGFNIDRWEIGNKEKEPYVMGVLRRVCITDTIEPIIDNTDKMARHLESLAENQPERTLKIRSFFTGAAVAEKCLIARLDQLGIKNFNLVTTDLSAESIAIAALNLSVWNELLQPQDKYDIRIVNGKVPAELYSKQKTIVLQVGDALSSSKEDKDYNPNFDALLLDNGLPYVSSEFGSELVLNIANCMGKDGLFIAALGLDGKIKVEIDQNFHIQNILKSFFSDIRKDHRIGKFNAPYNYPHYYGFSVDEKGNILINKVLSDGAGRTYNWLGYLIKSNIPRLKEVMKTIKSATELSRAKNSVVTTPFKSHVTLVKALTEKGYRLNEIEKPLEIEKFGWKQIGDNLYSKDGKIADCDGVMEDCRQIDPLVLRKTIIQINSPTQEASMMVS